MRRLPALLTVGPILLITVGCGSASSESTALATTSTTTPATATTETSTTMRAAPGSTALDPQTTADTDLATATELIDAWVKGWNTDDPDAVAAVFTENAVNQDNHGQRTGRPAIRQHAEYYVEIMQEMRRTGEGRATEDGTYVFPVSFDYDFGNAQGSGTDAGEVEVELAGGFLSRLELRWHAAD
jgi:hypothetical protein